ncbi:MAG: hypothetical protein ACLFP1_03235 [Candidatus Goldiibacteriota bacterium]
MIWIMAAAGMLLYSAAVFLNKKEHIFLLLTAADILIFIPLIISLPDAFFLLPAAGIAFFMNFIIAGGRGQYTEKNAGRSIWGNLASAAVLAGFLFVLFKEPAGLSGIFAAPETGAVIFIVFLFLAASYAVFSKREDADNG